MTKLWTTQEAIKLCRTVEAVCVPFGCHVALTGGVLYKDGGRKDLDLLFYRVRQVAAIDREGLFRALEGIGLRKRTGWGWCYKGTYQDKRVDMFFPDPAYGVRVEPWRVRVGRHVRRLLGMSA